MPARLPEVFNASHRPWIAPDAARAALVAEVVRRCPSGALHYQAPGIPREQPDIPATIRAVERGPFLVRGDLRIQAADGSVTDTRAALCRCTRSARQPFCDAACEAPEPSLANDWIGQTVAIGGTVRLAITGPCPRCVMITLPQGDLPKDPGILRTAAQHNAVSVGVYASVLTGGSIRRGDPVTLT